MRSRPARLTLSALAWTALGAAAFFTFQTEQQITARRAALRTFEATARDATDALNGLQAGLQAYVAVGQAPGDWAPKVDSYLQTASFSISALRGSATSQASGSSLLDASSTATELTSIDRRVRGNLEGGDFQAAAATIFAEGTDAVGRALSNIDTAVGIEQRTADADEGRLVRAATYALGGAAGFSALILLALGLASPAERTAAEDEESANNTSEDVGLSLSGARVLGDDPPVPAALDDAELRTAAVGSGALAAAATLCMEFGRVRDASDLKALLEHAAEAMNARGLIVWLGNSAGADLRPVLAHGYSDQTLARIPTVARTADNAAAAAYRTGEIQTVRSRPGASQGAVVAPLLAADGCIGALTAEIRDRGEETEAVRALATIVASQLAGVLAASAEEGASAAPQAHVG